MKSWVGVWNKTKLAVLLAGLYKKLIIGKSLPIFYSHTLKVSSVPSHIPRQHGLGMRLVQCPPALFSATVGFETDQFEGFRLRPIRLCSPSESPAPPRLIWSPDPPNDDVHVILVL